MLRGNDVAEMPGIWLPYEALRAGASALLKDAPELVVSEHTARAHVGHILSKLDLRDRVQAVVLAYSTGLIRPDAGADMRA